jgi:hypothetical protein
MPEDLKRHYRCRIDWEAIKLSQAAFAAGKLELIPSMLNRQKSVTLRV